MLETWSGGTLVRVARSTHILEALLLQYGEEKPRHGIVIIRRHVVNVGGVGLDAKIHRRICLGRGDGPE